MGSNVGLSSSALSFIAFQIAGARSWRSALRSAGGSAPDLIFNSVQQPNLRDEPHGLAEVLPQSGIKASANVSKTAIALDAGLIVREGLIDVISIRLDRTGEVLQPFFDGDPTPGCG